MKTIRIKRHLAHPPDAVWAALTDGKQMEKWLMPNDFRPEVGHRFQFTTDPAPGFDGIVHCEVLEIDPDRLLKISWRGGGIDTTLTFLLEPRGTGTEITLIHEGFRIANVLPWMILRQGWKSILGRKLPAVLDDPTGKAA